VSARINRWHSLWLIVAWLFIGAATLTPGSGAGTSGPAPAFWCFRCTEFAGADAATNVLLFMPLGIALALAGLTPLRALAVGLLASMAIECAQHFGFPPNRVASISDIVTNSVGSLAGASVWCTRCVWMAPNRRQAIALVSGASVCVGALLAFTAWALGRDTGAATQVLRSPLEFTPDFGWFHGHTVSAAYNGTTITHASDGPVILQTAPTPVTNADIAVRGVDERDGFVPALFVHEVGATSPSMMLGQRGHDAEFQVALRASRLRLAQPVLVLRDAFRPIGDSVRTVRASIDGAEWQLTEQHGQRERRATLRVSLALGWSLFQTVVHVSDASGAIMTWLWLPLLVFPLGFWGAFVGAPTGAVRDIFPGRSATSRAFVACSAILAFTAVVSWWFWKYRMLDPVIALSHAEIWSMSASIIAGVLAAFVLQSRPRTAPDGQRRA
jgi:hypothetical protein